MQRLLRKELEVSSLVGGVGGALLGMAGSAIISSALAPGAPDTSGMNASAVANSAIAGRQQDLAEKQYTDQTKIYEQYAPLYKQQVEASIAAQAKSTAQSDDQWSDYKTTWRPVEQKLASAGLSYLDHGRQEQEAQRAASDTTGAYTQQREQSARSLAAAGASPEKIAALEAAGRLVEAKAVGGAMSGARLDTESKGLAYLDNAARFGRNMPSTGLAAASLAGSQGQQAQGAVSNLQAAAATPAATAAPLLQNAVSANKSAGSLFGDTANLQMQGDMNTYNATMGGIGAGLKAYGMYKSTEKSKDVDGATDGAAASDAIEKSPAKNWRYKPGLGDGSTAQRVGPMAESLAAAAPAVSDGKTVDGISLLGLHHASLGDHNKRLKRLERATSRKD